MKFTLHVEIESDDIKEINGDLNGLLMQVQAPMALSDDRERLIRGVNGKPIGSWTWK
jgi:hypothetical protein